LRAPCLTFGETIDAAGKVNAEKKDKTMGDKSPKSTKKKTGQKAKAVAAKKKK
jgi:hypothetical protein